MRVKRGADAVSDHHIVLATRKLRLKRCKPTITTTCARYNLDLLADNEIAETFKINFCNRYQVLQEVCEDDNILLEDKWQQTKRMWTETCQETVGRKKVKTGCMLRRYSRYRRERRRRPC